jgi:hypothetical protein
MRLLALLGLVLSALLLLCLLGTLVLVLLVRADMAQRGVSVRCAGAVCLYVAPNNVALTWQP